MATTANQPLRAKEAHLIPWSVGHGKTRYDYDNADWRLAEMLHDDFFGMCVALIRKGDLITITDCEDQIVTVRVDAVDKAAMKVWLSLVERLYAMPVVPIRKDVPNDPGLTYRWRSARGGGHAIVTRSNEIVAINFPSKEHAMQAIEVMYKTGNFTPPAGREPTAQFVSEAKLFRPVNYGQNVDREPSAAASG
jgi:hypothetical protein